LGKRFAGRIANLVVSYYHAFACWNRSFWLFFNCEFVAFSLFKMVVLMKKEIKFTPEQIDFICWQIGEWYLNWKKCMTPDRTPHKLGLAKEQLKTMICGNDYE
jgi:hypothetical protein